MDSECFCHPDGERGTARHQREIRVKAVCRSCPVLRQCRTHALAVREPYGVWGGLSRHERDLITGPPAGPTEDRLATAAT
jgi:WhiB family redox-sensing transcriptional regulator